MQSATQWNNATRLSQQDRLEEAVDFILQAIRHDPKQAVYHNNVANAYKGLALYEQAEKHYLDATQLNPSMIYPPSGFLRSAYG